MFKKAYPSIFNVPQPRQEWINGKFVPRHEKNEEAWVELFVDLVYVVLLSKMGGILHSCTMDAQTTWSLFFTFASMCLTRQAIDEYANRFYSHDLMHKVIYLIYTAGLFVQVLNVNTTLPTEEVKDYKAYDYSLSSSVDSPDITHFGSTGATGMEATKVCVYVPEFGLGMVAGILITRISIISSKS